MKKVFSAVVGIVLLAPFAAFAATPTTNIDVISTNGCGSQSVSISGEATFSAPTDTLSVSSNGSQIYATSSQAFPWSFSSTFGAGSYSIEADILDSSSVVLASSTSSFSIGSCPAVSTKSGHMAAQGGHYRGAVIVTASAPYMYLIPDATQAEINSLLSTLTGVISVVDHQQ